MERTIMETILAIGIIAFITLLIYMWVQLAKYRKKTEKNDSQEQAQDMVYEVACAGTFETGIEEKTISVSLEENQFYDNKGNLLDKNLYNNYVVKGESMCLCGIHDKDLLFVEKGFTQEQLKEIALPDIFVIRRREAKPGEAKFKIRRGWRICNVQEDDLTALLEDIIKSDSFQTSVRNKKEYPGDGIMVQDFQEERLAKYRADYITCPNAKKENEVAILSTTLRTDINEIRFSLHPVTAIVGKVGYDFTVEKGE